MQTNSKHLSYYEYDSTRDFFQKNQIEVHSLEINYKKLNDRAIPPKKTKGNIGIDFHTTIESSVFLFPGERYLFPTGLSLEIPDGYAIILEDRSGISTKLGLHKFAGVIDSSYRGEIMVCLSNLSDTGVKIEPGQKIVQGIIVEDIPVDFYEKKSLSETDRGTKGFGSTG